MSPNLQVKSTTSANDAPDKNSNEEFSDALVDVIELIKNSSIGELELKDDDDDCEYLDDDEED